jgi:hypothetical protein
VSEGGTSLMSDIFRPYEKLVEITILGKKTFLVPERNSLLRAFQFISPETIPYGRFCWNQECQYCKVMCQLADDDQARPILSCKFIVSVHICALLGDVRASRHHPSADGVSSPGRQQLHRAVRKALAHGEQAILVGYLHTCPQFKHQNVCAVAGCTHLAQDST